MNLKKEVKAEETFIDRKEYYKALPYGEPSDISIINEPYMETSSFKPSESFFDESIYQQSPSTTEIENEKRFQKYLENYASTIPRAFIDDMIRSNGKEFDDKFGIYFNPDKETWTTGNSKLEFDGQDVLLGDEMLRYKDAPGLYELLFKKNPVGYRDVDLENYIDIIRRSEAHYKERKFIKIIN